MERWSFLVGGSVAPFGLSWERSEAPEFPSILGAEFEGNTDTAD